MESLSYWPRGGFARGECPDQRSGPRKGFTPGVGGSGCSDVRVSGDGPYPPTPAPSGLPGPASLVGPLQVLTLACSVDPGITTRYTHPVIPRPVHPSCPTPSSCTTPPCSVTTGTCTYDRFESPVGEPRGVEYTHVSGSRAGLYLCSGITRPFD